MRVWCLYACVLLSVAVGAAPDSPRNAVGDVAARQAPAPRPAQPFPAAVSGAILDRPQLIVSPRRGVRVWEQARQKFEKGEYQSAIEMAYGLLRTGIDGFHRSETDASRLISLRHGVRELIRRLPREQWAWYELQYGVTAKAELQRAQLGPRRMALERVARDFPLTHAGLEARYRLGMLCWDRGERLAAALVWDRLLSAGRPTQEWEPQLSVRTALAWYACGKTQQAVDVLQTLTARKTARAIQVAGQSLRLPQAGDDHQAWLRQHLQLPDFRGGAHGVDWMMSGNNPSRTGVGSPSDTIQQQAWSHNLLQDPLKDPALNALTPTDKLLRQALGQLDQRYRRQRQPLIASAQPVVVKDTIYVRSVGTHRAVLLNSGSRVWETMASEPVEDVLTRKASAAQRLQLLTRFLDQQIQYDDVYGTLSADEQFLYTIERVGTGRSGVNWLVAYHAAGTRRAGQRAWSVGGPIDDAFLQPPLAGTLFLGPPLPINDLLFVMARRKDEYLLLALDPRRSGRTVWTQPLATATSPLTTAAVRGCQLSYADGILVCCCDSQTVAAVDLVTRSLLWGYQPRTPRPKPLLPQRPRPGPRPGPFVPHRTGWIDRHALIDSGRVVLTVADTDELHCLNLADGTVEWKVPRGDGLYIAGLDHDRAIVVGRGNIRALQLGSGQVAWNRPLPNGKPAGRALIHGQHLHLPLDSGQIVSIALASGQQVGLVRSPGEAPWLNLVHARGFVIAQGLDRVSVFPIARLAAASD